MPSAAQGAFLRLYNSTLGTYWSTPVSQTFYGSSEEYPNQDSYSTVLYLAPSGSTCNLYGALFDPDAMQALLQAPDKEVFLKQNMLRGADAALSLRQNQSVPAAQRRDYKALTIFHDASVRVWFRMVRDGQFTFPATNTDIVLRVAAVRAPHSKVNSVTNGVLLQGPHIALNSLDLSEFTVLTPQTQSWPTSAPTSNSTKYAVLNPGGPFRNDTLLIFPVSFERKGEIQNPVTNASLAQDPKEPQASTCAWSGSVHTNPHLGTTRPRTTTSMRYGSTQRGS